MLLETLRREGYEVCFGSPKPVMLPDPDPSRQGGKLEPIEECTMLVKEDYAVSVAQKLTVRKGP